MVGLYFLPLSRCFFFNDTATTEIYTLSLHDALPIFEAASADGGRVREAALDLVRDGERRQQIAPRSFPVFDRGEEDRKSTRLNSSHGYISYAVFCLKKKK